ncbi:hypothetical protein HanRHA438_Chr16g0775481 [Helianthus annuus]|nr:hypothetical protein HanRHA438_Chr16g0775481 [Helianthus annuus]
MPPSTFSFSCNSYVLYLDTVNRLAFYQITWIAVLDPTKASIFFQSRSKLEIIKKKKEK